jgi:hypothetical protein
MIDIGFLHHYFNLQELYRNNIVQAHRLDIISCIFLLEIEADERYNQITTLYRGKKAIIKDLPVLMTLINVKPKSSIRTKLKVS